MKRKHTHWDRRGANDYLDSGNSKHGAVDVFNQPVKRKPGEDETKEVLEDNHQREAFDSNIA